MLFKEPRLHRSEEPVTIREQVSLTARSLTGCPQARRRCLAAMTAVLAQAVSVRADLACRPGRAGGPVRARLGRARRHLGSRRLVALVSTWTAVPSPLRPPRPPSPPPPVSLSSNLAVVVVAQTTVALMLAVISIDASKLLHDAIPSSSARASPARSAPRPGCFLRQERVLGRIARAHGVDAAGLGPSPSPQPWWEPRSCTPRSAAPNPFSKSLLAVARQPGDLDCRTLVDLVTDHLDGMLDPAQRALIERHPPERDGCTTYLAQIRESLAVLEALGTTARPAAIEQAEVAPYPGRRP